jgi:hypothetical protein
MNEHHPSPSHPSTPAPALDCGTFRRIADWASGMVDEPLSFQYGLSGQLRVGRPAGDRPLHVPAFTKDPARRVASLLLQTEHGSVELVDGTDAVFWSEAAVEKFVLPGYASLAAGSAAPALAQLMGVWAGTTEGVQVVALTHYARPVEPGATTLADTLGVVYVPGGGAPTRTTLAAFIARYRPDLQAPVLAVPNPAAPAPAQLPLAQDNRLGEGEYAPSCLELRVMAEWSSSLRGASAWFVYDATRPPDLANPYARVTRRLRQPAPMPGTVVIPAFTQPLVPGRAPVRGVDVVPDGAPEAARIGARADAVFWSTGAVEHLLMPYYARVYGGQALGEIRELYEAWWHNRPRGEAADAAAAGGVEIYAFMHLPDSMWVPAQEEGPEVSRSVSDVTGVVFTGPEHPDQARVLTLREFLRRHPR